MSWDTILAQSRKVCDGGNETQEVSGSTKELLHPDLSQLSHFELFHEKSRKTNILP